MLQKLLKSFFLWFSFNIITGKLVVATITVKEVPAGHLAELPCPSNDDQHRFAFWQLSDGINVVSPGNSMDERKYNYEVLTGKLMIRGVSTAESGFYKCVSRRLDNPASYNIEVVELVVKKDWEDIYNNSYETNTLRVVAVFAVLGIVGGVIFLIITIQRKRDLTKFFQMLDSKDNSPEREPMNTATTSAPVQFERITNSGFEDDFPKVFEQMKKNQAHI